MAMHADDLGTFYPHVRACNKSRAREEALMGKIGTFRRRKTSYFRKVGTRKQLGTPGEPTAPEPESPDVDAQRRARRKAAKAARKRNR
jgi:hypothetical protein